MVQSATGSTFAHPVLDPRTHFLPSLQSLPAALRHSFPKWVDFAMLNKWLQFYQTADSLQTAVAICGLFSVYVYVMQEITGNASQVDGLWTFLPVIYVTHFTFFRFWTETPPAGQSSWSLVEPRLALLWALTLIWCARLTYNAYRRGMFKKGEEDYRWPVLRSRMNRISWEIFTITFIAPIQNVLLALTGLPAYILSLLSDPTYARQPATRPPSTLVPFDYLIALALIANLTVQFTADHQQWVYQNFKRGLDVSGVRKLVLPAGSKAAQDGTDAELVPVYEGHTRADAKRGFVTRGLWAWSRHPNFACEQTTWWIFFAFIPLTFYPASALFDFGNSPVVGKASAAVANAPWWTFVFNYGVLGAISMNILFFGSTVFSESLSAEKYPAYKYYQQRVGMFLPIDTLLRTIYYKFVAGGQQSSKVEAEVWGASQATGKKLV